MAGKAGEQPSLVVVRDDELVVGADALLIDQLAEELDALAGRGAFAQNDAGVAVLADTGISQGSAALASAFMYVVSVAEQETPFSLMPASE